MQQPLTLMAVHAHPDDECSTGGTLARYAAEGFTTVLVTCTGGEEGEIVDPEMDVEIVKPRLAEVRLAELRASAEILGIHHLELLGYRDSGMAGTPANDDPRSFNKADPEEATCRLVALIRRHRPQVLFTYDEDGGYGHPDHLMAHKITVAAFDAAGDRDFHPDLGEPWQPQKLYYTAWMMRSRLQGLWRAMRGHGLPVTFGEPDAEEPPEWGTPDGLLRAWIDVRPYVGARLESLRVHRSQIRRDSMFLRLPEVFAREYLGTEGFRFGRSLVESPDIEDDLFAGVRVPVAV